VRFQFRALFSLQYAKGELFVEWGESFASHHELAFLAIPQAQLCETGLAQLSSKYLTTTMEFGRTGFSLSRVC
jgi:hypothetical protein